MKEETLTISVGGKDLTFSTGKIARQANGAVIVRSGDTMLLTTACASFSPSEADFLPLRVDYTEKFSSAGKTLGGFIKREGRPTERSTLICRLIDRPLRPMFGDGYFQDTQIISTVISYDGIHSPDPLAICGASAALVISDIPFMKPVGAVRVGMIDDQFIVNPTIEQMKESSLDLMLAGTADAILMIEGFCDFLTEEQLLEAINEGHTAIKAICQGLSDWRDQVGKDKVEGVHREIPRELLSELDSLIKEPLAPALKIIEKKQREAALAEVNALVDKHFFPEGSEPRFAKLDVNRALKKTTAKYMREMILDTNKRCDGRGTSDIRKISIETDILPRAHGSALFTRGETQAIAVATLGGEDMAQRFEDLDGEGSARFYLQYFFPPYSVGEVGRMGPAARREVGHGKLAEKSLAAILPAPETFPYTIRLESNITESNGSSSMASVCGGCLAMMAGGVPITRPIAGIAMGLILEGNRYTILSDILGVEDALGDMDFKVTGDEKGITAFQLDIKVEGITPVIMEAALAQAKEGRIHILKKMVEAMPEAKTRLSEYAPRIETMYVPPSKIGTVIGPGGKQIRAIIEETGVDLNIDDDGKISMTCTNAVSLERAKEIIHNLTAEVEVGKHYKGQVVGIKDFGLFVRIYSQEGLCHISEISHKRIDKIHDLFKEGDMIDVKVLEINDHGKIRLSRKALLKEPAPQ